MAFGIDRYVSSLYLTDLKLRGRLRSLKGLPQDVIRKVDCSQSRLRLSVISSSVMKELYGV